MVRGDVEKSIDISIKEIIQGECQQVMKVQQQKLEDIENSVAF